MASTSGPSLAHRSVSNIRTAGSQSPGGSGAGGGGPGSNPQTPLRGAAGAASAFGSPSTLRAEEDTVVIELGTRRLRVGFAGDVLPKAVVGFGPAAQRRVGDLRPFQADYVDEWQGRPRGKDWGVDHELWRWDIRGLDLGLVGDKMERALREAYTK